MENTATQQRTARGQVIDLNNKYIKSYATREMLVKKMAESGANTVPHIICRNDAGRWTVICLGTDCLQVLGLDSGFPIVGGY